MLFKKYIFISGAEFGFGPHDIEAENENLESFTFHYCSYESTALRVCVCVREVFIHQGCVNL